MRDKIKLVSSAGTGHYYTTTANKSVCIRIRWQSATVHPVVRKHVAYKESKDQIAPARSFHASRDHPPRHRAGARGRRIVEVIVRDRRLRWPIAKGLEAALRKQTGEPRRTGARQYFLSIALDGGTLIVHLGMSGKPAHAQGRPAVPRARSITGTSCSIRARRCAFTIRAASAASSGLAKILCCTRSSPGSPLNPWARRSTRSTFTARPASVLSRSSISSWKPRRSSWAGNIYASEALFLRVASQRAARRGASRVPRRRPLRAVDLSEVLRGGGPHRRHDLARLRERGGYAGILRREALRPASGRESRAACASRRSSNSRRGSARRTGAPCASAEAQRRSAALPVS